MSIEIKQMLIKSNITQKESQDENPVQTNTENVEQQRRMLNEFQRSFNNLISQKRER